MLDAPTIERLARAARRAARVAYAPYSAFRVGAALLDDRGGVHRGANVENASYGLTICAERAAVFSAVARGRRAFRALANYTPTAEPTPPCGACRQVLAEISPDIEIVSVCDGPASLRAKLSDLLPSPFGPNPDRS